MATITFDDSICTGNMIISVTREMVATRHHDCSAGGRHDYLLYCDQFVQNKVFLKVERIGEAKNLDLANFALTDADNDPLRLLQQDGRASAKRQNCQAYLIWRTNMLRKMRVTLCLFSRKP